jgi:hypothetical protein
MCRLRFVRKLGDGAIEQVLTEPPFGETWSVTVPNGEFCLAEDHWQALFLWGGGFRIFFQSAFVPRFRNGDVDWLEEYYADES